MAFKANLNSQSFKDVTVIDYTHPPVVCDLPVETGQGELEAGLVVAFNADGKVVPYDATAAAPVNDPVGILTTRVDTDNEDIAPVLMHGCANAKSVSVNGNPCDENTVLVLRKKQIFVR